MKSAFPAALSVCAFQPSEMASKIERSDIDFLNVIPEWDNSIDDLTLSQTCKDAENENTAFEKLEDLTLSQALDQYEVDFEMDDLPDFELTQVPLTADNIIDEMEKTVTVICNENSRYLIVEDIDIDKLVKSTESRNTRKNTTWSVATFNDWRVARMKSNYCAIPELLQFTANDVNQWLSKFVIETRRKDGKPYPPNTLYLLCVGILRFHRENGVHMNFLDEKDCVFYDFRRSLTELTKQGIGTTTKQAEAISEETESTLWEKGLLGSTSSKAIMNTMFFYNSKLFGLRVKMGIAIRICPWINPNTSLKAILNFCFDDIAFRDVIIIWTIRGSVRWRG
ncbi:unnamed protein product [Mytilus edulis]|uniref:QRICH1-like domain-containing protein n=1 Tax=Mytilus edulis TaxID=6550 RepID=A0A8S3PMU4_MYTED|nr:unnamed protein product [Mytilus edulis]